ncbi:MULTISPECIES: DUF2637 domain-containing protein [unclassified Streptomyces]|uniref:DUF2637 domain-containing protein n=1 Tax=unclassified Streptomyces TaxID=2593676 RepID=UPI0035E1D24B
MAAPMSARFGTMSEAEIRSAENTLKAGTWAITAGALLFSVLTVTPLVRTVSPSGWEWTAPILPLVVDAAVIIVVQLDSVISRLGGSGGAWPAILRWMTGVMTLALNVGISALHRDWVGMAVHSVAPLLLIVTAEAGLSYRRAISAALDRIAQDQAQAAERQRAEHEAAAQRQREERQAEKAAAQKAAREAREHDERLEQERADREAARLLAEQEYALALERERSEREERELAAKLEQDRIARDHAARMERERAERELAERRRQEERQDRERREKALQDERARRERDAQRDVVAAVQAARPQLPKQAAPRAVEPVVMTNEFSGMTQSDAETALFRLYRDARDVSTYENWTDDPQGKPGGEFCGSNLGRRLGRSEAAGRNNVKPKFEQWYTDYLKEKSSTENRELVGASTS